MSVEAIAWALSADVGSATRKLVLIGYANHAHKDGSNAFPAKATIAAYANCDTRTVIRHVNALIADGWIRAGDQGLVDHMRGDRRPVVYDLAMDNATREAWSTGSERGDKLSPRQAGRGDILTGRPDGVHGVHGVTKPTPRGDTAVSPEPSTNQEPLTPPGCARHQPNLGTNCRGCGTSPRQLEEQRQRIIDDRRREEAAQLAAAERAAREARDRADPAVIERAREAARAGAR